MRRGPFRASIEEAEGERVVGAVETPAGTTRISYRVHGAPAAASGDALLAAALIPAMRGATSLRIDDPVSSRLLAGLPRIQERIHSWWRAFRPIPVEAEEREDAAPRAAGVACFFSGGVDSFYSVLAHRDELTALLFVDGIELELIRAGMREQVNEALAEAAAELGKPLVRVACDIRGLTDPYVSWEISHGAVLASVALVLSRSFGTVYVPGTYGVEFPWGSHPHLDPLWSTDVLELVHDAAAVDRFDKVAAIAHHPVVERRLRVCWRHHNAEYNCGRCEKCLRTMASLRILGVLDRFEAFPAPLDLEALVALRIHRRASRERMHENLRALEASDVDDPELRRALEKALRAPAWYRLREAVRLRVAHRPSR